MREWSVFDVDSIREYSPDSVDGIRTLLMLVKNEFVIGSFDVFKVVKGMLQLFVRGEGLSVARAQIDRVNHELGDLVEIAGTLGPDNLRHFVEFCTKLLNTFAATLALTAKSSPDERSQCLAALKWLLRNWPLAVPSESEAINVLGNLLSAYKVASDDVKEAVAKEADRIGNSMAESMNSSLTNVKKQIKVCTRLLKDLDVEQETEFRKLMTVSAPKLAGAAQKLKAVSDQVKAAYDNQGLSFAEQDGELFAEVAETDAMAIYHITVYAALTLYRDAQTWVNAASQKAFANLKQAVGALDTAPAGVVALEIKFNHQVVVEMRAELKMPRPKTAATVSDQAVSTGSEATVPAQPAPTSSEATVPSQEVSAVPIMDAPGQPVPTSPEATASGQEVSAASDSAQPASTSPEATVPGQEVASSTEVFDQSVLIDDGIEKAAAAPAKKRQATDATTKAAAKAKAELKRKAAAVKTAARAAAKTEAKQTRRSRVTREGVNDKAVTRDEVVAKLQRCKRLKTGSASSPSRDGGSPGVLAGTGAMNDADEDEHEETGAMDEDEVGDREGSDFMRDEY